MAGFAALSFACSPGTATPTSTSGEGGGAGGTSGGAGTTQSGSGGQSLVDAGSDANGDASASSGGSPPGIVGRAFAFSGSECAVCPAFILVVTEESDTATKVEIGTAGEVTSAELARDGASWKVTQPIVLTAHQANRPLPPCENSTTLLDGELSFADHDGDGNVDLLVTGTLSDQRCSDDTSPAIGQMPISLQGFPPTENPSWEVFNAPRDPIDSVVLTPSEPLTLDSMVTATSAALGISLPFAATSSPDGYLLSFSNSTILPFGSTFSIDGPAIGMGGLAVAAATLQVIADPGLLANDGFESGSLTGVFPGNGIVMILDGSQSLPVLTGTRSLLVPAGVRALLHLARTGSETQVVLTIRASGAFAAIPVEVGTIGGIHRGTASVDAVSGGVDVMDGGNDIGPLGPVRKLAIPLPDGGADVIVSIRPPSIPSSEPTRVDAIVDDVHLE